MFLSLQENLEAFYSFSSYGFYWQLIFYTGYNFYSIHTYFTDAFGNALLPPFYLSVQNGRLLIIVGFTQNLTLNLTGQNIPTNDLFFAFSEGNYVNANFTLFTLADFTNAYYLAPGLTLSTNYVNRATCGFGVIPGHF